MKFGFSFEDDDFLFSSFFFRFYFYIYSIVCFCFTPWYCGHTFFCVPLVEAMRVVAAECDRGGMDIRVGRMQPTATMCGASNRS